MLGYIAVMENDRSVGIHEVKKIIGRMPGDRVGVQVGDDSETRYELAESRICDTQDAALEALVEDVQAEHRLRIEKAATDFQGVISECARDMLGCELAKTGISVHGEFGLLRLADQQLQKQLTNTRNLCFGLDKRWEDSHQAMLGIVQRIDRDLLSLQQRAKRRPLKAAWEWLCGLVRRDQPCQEHPMAGRGHP